MKLRLIISLLMMYGYCHAQQFSYKQFTTAEGLPSNVVYDAFQDADGYIWFCTNAGVSRFNGISFQNFSAEQGLSDNEVFGAFQINANRIWFRTFSNKLCYYEKGKFYNHKNQPWLNTVFGGIRHAYIDKKGITWARSYLDTYVYSLDEKNKRIIQQPYKIDDSNSIVVTESGVDTILIRHEQTIHRKMVEFGQNYRKQIESLPDVISYFMFIRKYVHELSKDFPDVPLHFMYNVFLTPHPVTRFRLHDLKIENDSSYWLTHANKGIAYGRNIYDLDEKPEEYLPQRNINNILVDREGNYWFTSPTEGVFLLNAHGVKTYDSEGEGAEIYSVTGNDRLIIYGKDSEVKFINKQTGEKFSWKYDLVHNSSVYNRMKDLLADEEGNCWVATDFGAALIQINQKKVSRVFPELPLTGSSEAVAGSMKCLSNGSGDNIYLGSHSSLFRIGKDRTIELLANKRVTAVVELNKDELLIGSLDGLSKIHNGVISPFLNDSITLQITDLQKSKNGFVCAATNDMGLIILVNGRFYRIMATSAGQRLTSNICRKLFIDTEDNIWVSTNKGLCRVKISSLQPFKYQVRQFTTSDGLISNDVNDVYVSGDTVWAATSGGLSYFRQSEIKQTGAVPFVYISNADTLRNRSFRHRSKIAIGLEGLSYESLGKMRYRYRIKGLYEDWRNTERSQLLYDVIPPGTYQLEVYSINRFGQESAEPATVTFTILPPWWRSAWAFILYIILFIGLLATAYVLVRRNSRMKERNRMKLEQLELQALRSQMNPHFIFNTLNAVQKYILENDKESSYRYLTRFSKLIRGFLENSRQTTITLKDELDLLRSYMEMEALRFRHKFTYEIEISPELDTASIYVPSMLIQPYVENAIWHGIQHKGSNGFVKLSVQDHGNNMIRCTIQDNGIGRKKAGEIASFTRSQHQPVGMTITQQRLELINQRLKQAVSVNFIDLEEQTGGAETGTIVELIITYSIK
ncbi:MAG TPA: histidine kinase [Chitinophagaceae bacterium]